MTQQPEFSFVPQSANDDLSNHLHRQVIGYLGVAMPLLLWLIAGIRPIKDVAPWDLLGSISAYYYTGAVVVFTGTLVALGLFLLTYRGYDNDAHRRDRNATLIAGFAALGVAFFPTNPGALPGPDWWKPGMGVAHITAAFVLFLSFTYFSLRLFPKSNDTGRNRIYYICGYVILGSLAWATVGYFAKWSIFWPETVALLAFGISWLVKGKADWTARQLGSRVANNLRSAFAPRGSR